MEPAHDIRENGLSQDSVDDQVDGRPIVNVESDVFPLVPRTESAGEPLVPGVQLSENIRLIELLGQGGMGNVWLAHHAGLETQVAVKFMSTELAENESCVARFGTEAKLAARIKSPHVVTILDFATTATGVPYIVMELLRGQDLDTHICNRALDLDESSRVLVQICKALSQAHELGIVHRDIKPDNVFLMQQEGELFVKVLDFGIAKDECRTENITVSGTTMGTPAFMSPEQLFRPKEVDLRSDLWSAAIVAYRCLTGRLPFEGENFGTMCISIHDGVFPPPSSIDPSLPRELDAWFEKALALDPNARFQSANEMANAYLTALEDAGLLPRWAAPPTDRTSYTSDPGGLARGPTVAPSRPPLGKIVILATLSGVFLAVAAWSLGDVTPATIDGWVRTSLAEPAQLNPTPDEPPLDFAEPIPTVPAPPSAPARANADVERPQPQFVPRRHPIPLSPWPEPIPSERPPPPPSSLPSAVFGI